jgi:hypothetical protein
MADDAKKERWSPQGTLERWVSLGSLIAFIVAVTASVLDADANVVWSLLGVALIALIVDAALFVARLFKKA